MKYPLVYTSSLRDYLLAYFYKSVISILSTYYILDRLEYTYMCTYT